MHAYDEIAHESRRKEEKEIDQDRIKQQDAVRRRMKPTNKLHTLSLNLPVLILSPRSVSQLHSPFYLWCTCLCEQRERRRVRLVLAMEDEVVGEEGGSALGEPVARRRQLPRATIHLHHQANTKRKWGMKRGAEDEEEEEGTWRRSSCCCPFLRSCLEG